MTLDQPASPVDRIRFPQPIAVREVWPSEPRDFTPWLSANLVALDDLGLGRLTCVGTEVVIPGTDRALDILAEAATGEKVAIENQYGRADHDHLTRGLAYAVGLQAQALVVIAEEHRGEFRAVADYLNRAAEKAGREVVHVYLVELRPEAVGEYVVPRLTIVIAPNAWREEAAGVPTGEKLTVEQFLASVPDPVTASMASVLDWWGNEPGGSLRFAASSISLDRPHPSRPGKPLSHVLLWTKGSHTIQRGYLREAGIVTDDVVEEFDSLVRQLFPGATWAAKSYFLDVPGAPNLDSVQRFFRWCADHSYKESP